jgi:lipopolysaccharide export system protein LptA
MRTLVLAAAVLLIGLLVVFLVIGKGKNFFSRRDLPQRLGLNIQQEGNGYTYSHVLGAHSQYKIHASKVVQLKQGNMVLHDVKIELYGEDGSRVDRIEGAEFEYDKKSGTIKAAGPVEITLMRPGEAPAIAPKATAGQALGSKLKGAPVATAAEAAARGEIHVKTSGLSFDQNSGVATTSEHLDFSTIQGTGSAMGATYDSQKGLLVLDRAVELAAQRGAETVVIHAQHAEFVQDDQLCRLHEVIADYKEGRTTAGDAKVLFRDDGSAQRLDALNGFTLTTTTGSRLSAPTGHMEFNEKNQPRQGYLEGGVTMESASEQAGRRRQLHGTAPTAALEFNPQGQLHHAHLELGVAMDSEEQSQTQRLSRHWRSPVADVEFSSSADEHLEPSEVRGTGGVTVTGEAQLGNAAALPSRLSADELAGAFGPGSGLTDLHGVGHVGITETTAKGVRQTASGDRLEVHFAAPTASSSKSGAKPAVNSGAAANEQIQSARIEGHVVLTRVPAAKPGVPPSSTLRAFAGRADYEGQGEWLHLTVNPRVEDGALQLAADKVELSRVTGEAFAHGNVKATQQDEGAAGSGQPSKPVSGQGGIAFGGDGPAHVVAAEAEMNQATGEASFRGQARLWQQANSVSAPLIVLNRDRHSLAATTASAAEPVRAVLVSESSTDPARAQGKEGGKEQAKAKQPSVIRVRGGDLKYSDLERKAVMRAGLLSAVVAEMGTATSSSNEVEVLLLPASKNASRNTGQSQVDHLTARGHVVLTSEGRRGAGEQLVYTGATNEYVLTGTATVPPKMTDPSRGTVTGEALIFHGRDDSVTVEGGGHKTTTETTAPK